MFAELGGFLPVCLLLAIGYFVYRLVSWSLVNVSLKVPLP